MLAATRSDSDEEEEEVVRINNSHHDNDIKQTDTKHGDTSMPTISNRRDITRDTEFRTLEPAFNESDTSMSFSCMASAGSSDDDDSAYDEEKCDTYNDEKYNVDVGRTKISDRENQDLPNSSSTELDDDHHIVNTIGDESVAPNSLCISDDQEAITKGHLRDVGDGDHQSNVADTDSSTEQLQKDVPMLEPEDRHENTTSVLTESASEEQENVPAACIAGDDDDGNNGHWSDADDEADYKDVYGTPRKSDSESNDSANHSSHTPKISYSNGETQKHAAPRFSTGEEEDDDEMEDDHVTPRKLYAELNTMKTSSDTKVANTMILNGEKTLDKTMQSDSNVKDTELVSRIWSYGWSTNHNGPNITILPDRSVSTARRQVVRRSTDGVRGCRGFLTGRHTFQLAFNGLPWGSHCGIGVCAETTALHANGYRCLLGQDPTSWAWDIPSGRLMYDGHITGKLNVEDWEARRPSLILDMDQGTLSVGIADKPPAIIHTGLTACDTPLYPAVSLVYGLAEVTIRLVATNSSETRCEVYLERNGNDDELSDRSDIENVSVHEMCNDKKNVYETNMDLVVTRDSSNETEYPVEPVCTYTEVNQLWDDDQYLTQLGHGWDLVKRGGQIAIYPSVPYICIPSINFTGSVQGIRSRQGFTYGQHDWLIKEVKHFTPNVPLADVDTTQNDVIIGIVSDQHRTFNYGYSLDNLGDYAWAWRPLTNQKWHRKTVDRTPPGDSCNPLPSVNLSRGVEVHLDIESRTLSLSHDDEQLACFTDVCGDVLYPCVWFHETGVFPLTMQYARGPSEHIENVISTIHKLASYEKDSFWNRRSLSRQPSTVCTPLSKDDVPSRSFLWGHHSSGVKIQNTEVHVNSSIPGPAWAISADGVSIGRHCIDIVCTQPQCLTLALVAAKVDCDDVGLIGEGGFGSTLQSWNWDIDSLTLHHAGNSLGKFPYSAHDFEATLYHRYRMIVDFDRTGQNTASVVAIGVDESHDLGIAFLNLPPRVHIGVGVSNATDDVIVKMTYRSGPEYYVGTSQQSTSCTVL